MRGDDGQVRADPAAHAVGRGAYVCADPDCAASLGKGHPLARSFRAPVAVPQQTLEFITAWQRSASTR